MNEFFLKVIYKLYYFIKNYARKREILQYKKIATLHEGAIIGTEGRIGNNRDSSSITIGDKTILKGELLTFKHGGKIEIGDWCYIGVNTRIWSAKKISIGNRVLIAHNVNVFDQNSHPMDSKERHLDQIHIMEKGFQSVVDLKEKEVIIKDDAWIGFNATILKGVTIGRGAIIGACTLITEDVPDFAVVVGNPARIVKYTT
jgi:acetyltransferase-like isoleucine patch superfamily enzyme